MPEKLHIPEFGTLSYSNPIFSIESNSLDITLERDEIGCNIESEQSPHEGDPFDGKNVPIHFPWNDEIINATIYGILNVYHISKEQNIITHLVLKLSDIHGYTDNHTEFESISFFIPYVKCRHKQSARNHSNGWAVCKSEMTFGGRKWVFMDAYDNGHAYPVAYEMTDKGNQLCGTLIETTPSQFSDFSEIRHHVFHLCTMLGFAMGKAHMWISAWGIKGTDVHFITASGHTFNPANTSNAIIYYGDDQHRCVVSPVEFVDGACKEFYTNAEWWQVTLNWVINGNSACTIEVTKLIDFVLLDRVTSKIFALITKSALQTDLEIYTSNSKIRKYIGIPLETKIKKLNTKLFTTEEREFITMCKTWAHSPNYMTKVKAICEFAGLKLTTKEEQQIEMRNNLVHQGRLQLAINQVMNYATKTTSFTRALILASLGYNGYFAAYSKRPAVTEVFPFADRLRLSNIERLASKLLTSN